MHAQLPYWIAGAAVALLVIAAVVAERRRASRRDLDAMGWVPWRGMQVTGMFALVLILILALRR